MGHELRSFCLTDTKKLLWIMGITFAVVITFQYVELPYSNVISSLFSTRKIPVMRNTTSAADAPLSNSVTSDYTSDTNTVNSTDQFPVPQSNETSRADGFASEGNGSLNGTAQRNESIDPVKNPSAINPKELKAGSVSNFTDDSSNSTFASGPIQSEGHEQGYTQKNKSLGWDSSPESRRNNSVTLIPGYEESSKSNNTSLSYGIPRTNSEAIWPEAPSGNAAPPVSPNNFKTSAAPTPDNSKTQEQNISATPTPDDSRTQEQSPKFNSNASLEKPPISSVPKGKRSPEVYYPGLADSGYLTISEMNYLLQQSRTSHRSKRPKWDSEADQELVDARNQIEDAPIDNDDPVLYAPVFRNISMFKRSYALMEKMLKVYVYKEGKKPIMHVPVLKGIYASEGWFMKLLESNKNFVTKDPKKAHLFYLPFSSRLLEETLYVKDSHSHKNLIEYLKNYLDLISAKYPFWNRTRGADHFLVACHDWAPTETRKIMTNCIRALCNSDVKEGFVFGKDVSLPETKMSSFSKPLNGLGGKPPSQRPILAFFAGKTHHGYLRPVLLSYWGDNKDPDMKIFGRLPRSKGNKNYINFMKSSKYCICAKGFEVNSPRVVEAIFYECVPVILSDNFVPPFFETLNWESFAVFVLEKDIPDLKKILLSIPEWRYRDMHTRVKKVQKHFLWHPRPEKYDIFHMILHSVWFNRVFQT